MVSVIYVGVMWMNHHAAFDRLKALSFPTAVLAEAFQNHNLSDERAAVVLYGLLAYAMGMSWWFFFVLVFYRSTQAGRIATG